MDKATLEQKLMELMDKAMDLVREYKRDNGIDATLSFSGNGITDGDYMTYHVYDYNTEDNKDIIRVYRLDGEVTHE